MRHENQDQQKETPYAKRGTIKYAEKISLATLNCRGPLEASKREQIVQIMHVHQIDLLALQETKVNSSSEEQRQHEGTGKQYSFSLVPMHNATLQQECSHNMPMAKESRHQHVAWLNIIGWVLLLALD